MDVCSFMHLTQIGRKVYWMTKLIKLSTAYHKIFLFKNTIIFLVVIILCMPFAQKLLDRFITISRKPTHEYKRYGQSFGLYVVCKFLEDLLIQPLKIIRAFHCLLNPGNEKYAERHNQLKVEYLFCT